MPGRTYAASNSYRYGFNGKENDNEVKGEGNQQDYGMRIYDPRLGRFLSVDPLRAEYPELTPYQFASNRPIDGIDLDGLEYLPANAKCKFISVELKYSISPENYGTVIGIQSATAGLNLNNVSQRLRNFCNDFNSNSQNWKSGEIGTEISYLGHYELPVTMNTEDVNKTPTQKELETFGKSPLGTYGRGTVPTGEKGGATATVGGGQIGAAISISYQVAKYYLKYKSYVLNGERKEASNEFEDKGWRVIARLDFAIQNNWIPAKYLKGTQLTNIANYFLSGLKANDLNVKFADDLWMKTNNLYYEEKTLIRKTIGNNNDGNTGKSPTTIFEEKTVLKKI